MNHSASTGESSLTKSSGDTAENNSNNNNNDLPKIAPNLSDNKPDQAIIDNNSSVNANAKDNGQIVEKMDAKNASAKQTNNNATSDGTQLVGTISFVEFDGIINPSQVCIRKPLIEQAIKMSRHQQAT